MPGELRYNGGVAAGDGIAQAPAYAKDTEQASRKAYPPTTTEAQLTAAIPFGSNREEFYPINVRAVSTVRPLADGKYRIMYEVTILASGLSETEKSRKGVSQDVRKLLNHSHVAWDSIPNSIWGDMDPILFDYGWVEDGKYLRFDKSGELRSPFEFKVSIDTDEPPELHSKSIRFLVGGNDEKVCDQAWAPAYAPAKAKRGRN